MIKRVVNLNNYWKVIAYFDINYNFSYVIVNDLRKIGCKEKLINSVLYNMFNHKAKAVTISSIKYKTSIVLFNNHENYYDYINSVVHEAEHIKQSILYAYNVEDYGEAPAYTVGAVASKLLRYIV